MNLLFLLIFFCAVFWLFKRQSKSKQQLVVERVDFAKNRKTLNEKIALSTYCLNVVIPLFVITTPFLVIPLAISYYEKNRLNNTYLQSHYIWQIRTFWFALMWAMVGFLTVLALIGYLIIFLDLVWFIYRQCEGILALSSGSEVPNIETKLLIRNYLLLVKEFFIMLFLFVVIFSSIYYIFSVIA